MAFISSPEQAVMQLSELLRNKKNPHDLGFLCRIGKAFLDATKKLEDLVDVTNEAQKGKVIVEFHLHAFRNKNREIVCKPKVTIGMKLPSEYTAAEGEFYLGDDGELSTSAIARDQEKMFAPEVIDGGKARDHAEPRKGRRAE